MSTEISGHVSEINLQGFSEAAVHAVRERQVVGNRSTYDDFLCNYIGDPTSAAFRQISMYTPGVRYDYNNFATIYRKFTPGGIMLNARHVQGMLQEGDQNLEYFVASADLRSGEIVEWRPLSVETTVWNGSQTTQVDLARPRQNIAKVPEPGDYDNPIDYELARREFHGRTGARLLLSSHTGNWFGQDGPSEPLLDIVHLVREVNTLTEILGIDLDEVARRAS